MPLSIPTPVFRFCSPSRTRAQLHSFYRHKLPTSRFCALVLTASFDLILCFRSAPSTLRHLLRPCHAFFPIPFDSINICANLASSSPDSQQSSILMPNILSQSMFKCLLRKTRSVSSRLFRLFCPLSSHHLLDSSSSRRLLFPSGYF